MRAFFTLPRRCVCAVPATPPLDLSPRSPLLSVADAVLGSLLALSCAVRVPLLGVMAEHVSGGCSSAPTLTPSPTDTPSSAPALLPATPTGSPRPPTLGASPCRPPRGRRRVSSDDPRLLVGAQAHTKATYVTSFAECSRLFGSLASTKVVSGTVLAVIAGLQRDSRRKSDLQVRWTVKSRTVDKTLSLSSVKAGPPPPPLPCPSQSGTPSTQVSQAELQSTPPASSAAPIGASSRVPPLPEADTRATRAPSQARTTPAATTAVHGVRWTAGPVSQPVGGPVARRLWSVRTMPGAVIMEGGDSVGVGRSRTAYDYFLSMFPMDQLTRMVRLTSTNLQGRGLPATTAGEMLKFIGVLILATRYEFGARAELWATKARNPYLVAPAFGERTGLSRCRFDALWTSLRFSERRCGGDDDSEESRWELVSEFVRSINDHRQAHVSPSE